MGDDPTNRDVATQPDHNRTRRYVHHLPPPGTVVALEHGDIVCGRGGAARTHAGNKRFNAAMELFHAHYFVAQSRHQKAAVLHTIYETLLTQGRFVKETSSHDIASPSPQFIIVTEKEAKAKIGHALRYKKSVISPEQRTTTHSKASTIADDGSCCSDNSSLFDISLLNLLMEDDELEDDRLENDVL
mmetsp:Transcript_8188/g.15870  ORF Transcript_8188/g.15870 Transcript_8188/m.15870 type:complete len:187 (+) Transcript_8188:204-764(+)